MSHDDQHDTGQGDLGLALAHVATLVLVVVIVWEVLL